MGRKIKKNANILVNCLLMLVLARFQHATNKDTFKNDLRRTKNIDQWKRVGQNVAGMTPADCAAYGTSEAIFGRLRELCPFA